MLLQFHYSLIYAPGQHRIRALQMEPPATWREAERGGYPLSPHARSESALGSSHWLRNGRFSCSPHVPSRAGGHTEVGAESPAFEDLSET